MTNDQVISFEGGNRVERAVSAKGTALAYDLIVVGIGITQAVDALAARRACPMSTPQGMGPTCSLHPVFGRVRVEHFNNAEQQGRAAARVC